MGNLNAATQGDLALARVAVAGGVPSFSFNRGFASIVDNGAGDFSLNLDNAQALQTAGLVFVQCELATFAQATVEVVDADTIRIRTWDAAGMALDNVPFWVRITPVSPT